MQHYCTTTQAVQHKEAEEEPVAAERRRRNSRSWCRWLWCCWLWNRSLRELGGHGRLSLREGASVRPRTGRRASMSSNSQPWRVGNDGRTVLQQSTAASWTAKSLTTRVTTTPTTTSTTMAAARPRPLRGHQHNNQRRPPQGQTPCPPPTTTITYQRTLI